MQKTALYFSETKASQQSYSPVQSPNFDAGSTSQSHTTLPVALTIPELERHAQDWLFDGEYRNHAATTIAGKRDVIKKLIWFLSTRQLQQCGVAELRQFLAYVANGHTDPNGRWGNPNLKKPVRPRTVKYYYVYLKGLFRWLVAEGILSSSPLERLAPPIARSEQVQPFTQDQIASLLQAARNSVHPRRNEAILLILVDSGMRASELCNLRLNDVDLSARRATVLGKGNKHRTVLFGRTAGKALWRYLQEQTRKPDDFVFLSDRGEGAGEPLTRSGLLQLFERLGKAAGLQNVRCSPHSARHFFAVEFLRNGGNVFSLQMLLGHSTLAMTSRYVALAQGDVERQHHQFSPADRLRTRAE